MTLADFLSREWRRSATSSAVILAVWSQFLMANSVSAAATSDRPSPQKANKKPTARIGVSAVVLPRCMISVAARLATGSAQPLEVKCTRDTDYSLAVSQGGRNKAGLSAASSTTTRQATVLVGKSNGQASYYQLTTLQQRPEIRETKVDGITVLSLDF